MYARSPCWRRAEDSSSHGSEGPSANGGHGADNYQQMAVTAAVHTPTAVLSLCSHQGNLPVSVNKA